MSDDLKASPPSVRSTVALVTAIAGLLSAIAAFQKAPQEPVAKESYTILQKAFIEQDVELAEAKKDLVNLRKAFEDYVKAKEGAGNVTNEPNGHGLSPVRIQVQPTPIVSVVASTPPAPTHVVMLPSVKATGSPRPPPPDFSVIQQKAAK